jgi:hypothetical protein
MQRGTDCENMNHRRSDAPVAHCPACGGIVNAAVKRAHCSVEAHTRARRERSIYCVWCGERLIARTLV